YIERNYEAAAVEGRIVQIAFQGSPKATVDFRRIMLKRLHHTGSTLRARAIEDKAAIARAVEERVWPLIAAGKVKPVMDKQFPLADAASAHARMESSAHIGKIVLTAEGAGGMGGGVAWGGRWLERGEVLPFAPPPPPAEMGCEC